MVARAGELIFFWCRWETARPLAVAFPREAGAEEQALLELALDAWEGAGLGVHFVRADAGAAAIAIELVDGPVSAGAGPDAGNSVTDCRLGGSLQAGADRIPAELDRARIRLARRTSADWRGQSRALRPAEFAGLALHELGHALGISGHARGGETVMVRDVDRVRRAGAELLEGRAFRDASAAALYQLPNGWILRRVRVDPDRTAVLDALWDRAGLLGFVGPFVRSGETHARVFWRGPPESPGGGDAEHAIVLVNWSETLRDPERVRFVPDP